MLGRGRGSQHAFKSKFGNGTGNQGRQNRFGMESGVGSSAAAGTCLGATLWCCLDVWFCNVVVVGV
jgi:hypothetical protein